MVKKETEVVKLGSLCVFRAKGVFLVSVGRGRRTNAVHGSEEERGGVGAGQSRSIIAQQARRIAEKRPEEDCGEGKDEKDEAGR